MESGIEDFESSSWVAILAPPNTPRPIVDRLNRELNAVLATPEIVEKLATLGIAPTPGPPERLSEQMKVDLEKYGKVVKSAGIKAE
jgi:tripartite-type tricarboxylate transporter receptor subunit TctC